MYYNTLVALPMSLSLMEDRLQQRYYRQLDGLLGDVATLEGNARAFCGDDSPVTEAAAGTLPPMPPPLPPPPFLLPSSLILCETSHNCIGCYSVQCISLCPRKMA